MSQESRLIHVEIVYARSEQALVMQLRLPAGSLLRHALEAASGSGEFRGVDLLHSAVGVHGLVAGRDRPLEDGDRVEIYRALAEDPKLARRKRARVSARRA